MSRYLRNKVDGTIYGWDEYLANNPKCEEVSEEEAFPERFMTEEVVERIQKKTTKKKAKKKKAKAKAKPGLDFSTKDIPEPPKFTSEELGIEASRDLP
jgi:hypothetical protein